MGSAQDNCLGFEARQVSAAGSTQQGSLALFWPGAPGAGTGAVCSAGVAWPLLDNVTVLGTGPIDTASVAITGRTGFAKRCWRNAWSQLHILMSATAAVQFALGAVLLFNSAACMRAGHRGADRRGCSAERRGSRAGAVSAARQRNNGSRGNAAVFWRGQL